MPKTKGPVLTLHVVRGVCVRGWGVQASEVLDSEKGLQGTLQVTSLAYVSNPE